MLDHEASAKGGDGAWPLNLTSGSSKACDNQILGVGCNKHGQMLQRHLSTEGCSSMASIAQELTLAEHELQSLHAQYSKLHQMCRDPQADSISAMQLDRCARPRL